MESTWFTGNQLPTDNYLTRIKASRITILLCIAFFMCNSNSRFSISPQGRDISQLNLIKHNKSLKYILIWTKYYSPVSLLDKGNSDFVKAKCKYTNCFFTDHQNYNIDVTDFDVVLFGGVDVWKLSPVQLPTNRSSKQKYIFIASESADRFPVCAPVYDGFFNWTWTYRIDSDLFWGYNIIHDVEDNFVGPSVDMKWRNKFDPIDEALKMKLSSKSKTAAWFISHCPTVGGRELFVNELQKELKAYQRTVDIFGACGNLSCPKDDEAVCFKKLENDYYFYLSFENSFSEDYVTEKLLHALNNYAVPVVYGTANYSRFLPPRSYLNALKLGPKRLARRMNEIIRDRSKYHDFFRWRNHYKYRRYTTERYCKLCSLLNDGQAVSKVTVWSDFRAWWNGAQYKDKCF